MPLGWPLRSIELVRAACLDESFLGAHFQIYVVRFRNKVSGDCILECPPGGHHCKEHTVIWILCSSEFVNGLTDHNESNTLMLRLCCIFLRSCLWFWLEQTSEAVVERVAGSGPFSTRTCNTIFGRSTPRNLPPSLSPRLSEILLSGPPLPSHSWLPSKKCASILQQIMPLLSASRCRLCCQMPLTQSRK